MEAFYSKFNHTLLGTSIYEQHILHNLLFYNQAILDTETTILGFQHDNLSAVALNKKRLPEALKLIFGTDQTLLMRKLELDSIKDIPTVCNKISGLVKQAIAHGSRSGT